MTNPDATAAVEPRLIEIASSWMIERESPEGYGEWLTPQMTWSRLIVEGAAFELYERAKAEAVLDIVLDIQRSGDCHERA